MFSLPRTFIFPRLISLSEVNFRSWSQQNTTSLYKLDWGSFDQEINRKHQEWNRRCWPAKDLPITQKFSDPYESLLQNFRYAIPQHYLEEIKHETRKAVMEWNRERHFDTNIRDLCLKPAIAHIKVAFDLLCDCLYDEETNYFLRNPHKYNIFVPLHLVRFWQHQTGAGMIYEHSGLSETKDLLQFKENRLEKTEHSNDEKSEIKELKDFMTFIKEHINNILKDNAKILEDQKPVEGPSLESRSKKNL